jgi:hypothetical protein
MIKWIFGDPHLRYRLQPISAERENGALIGRIGRAAGI